MTISQTPRSRTRRKWIGGGSAALLAIGLAAAPALSASADWLSYGYASCSGTYPTTMSKSPGYTYHQIHDGAGWTWGEHITGSTTIAFHSLGTGGSPYAGQAQMEIYSYTYASWSCSGGGYRYTGWP